MSKLKKPFKIGFLLQMTKNKIPIKNIHSHSPQTIHAYIYILVHIYIKIYINIVATLRLY